MPPTKVVKLDELAGEDIAVELRGKRYKVPADPPIPLYERMAALEDRVGNEDLSPVLLGDVRELVLDLFNYVPRRDRKPLVKALPADIGLATLLGAIGKIYADARVDPPRPVPQDRKTRTSKSGSKKSPSRK